MRFNLRKWFLSWALLFASISAFLCHGCGCEKRSSNSTGPTDDKSQTNLSRGVEKGSGSKETPILGYNAFPWLLSGKTSDGRQVSQASKNTAMLPNEGFNQKYSDALKLMEDEKLTNAVELFEDIVKSYPGSDEASLASYRIAQIHFRNKANSAALAVYKEIVEKYPHSPVSENARAAIKYLETFEKHEKAYISPDVEDRKRRGR
ncbi:tetratricopeptide repeat protein [bacterium]|nr:tetratricopeptide repeat protein [bacterium]